MRLPSSLFRPDPLAQQSYLENYSPGFMQMAGRAFDDSFGTSSLGLVESITEMQQAESTGMPLVEEEWRASGDYRPGLEYKDGLTDAAAKLLADRYDQARQTEFLMERSGALAWFGYATGTIMGAIPDPVNLIPFGFLVKGRYLTKLGQVATKIHKSANKHTEKALGRIVMSGAEGGLGAAALQPALAFERKSYQEEWDAKSASLDILAGVGAGMFFGAGIEGGRALLGRRRLVIEGDATDPDAVITTRADGEPPIRERIVEELTPSEMTAAARHSIQRFDDGEPPDVASVIGDKASDGTEPVADPVRDIPEDEYYLLDEDGNYLGSVSGRGAVQFLKEEASSSIEDQMNWKYKKKMKLHEFIDQESGRALYIGKKDNLVAGGYEETFNPAIKPKYTTAQPEPEVTPAAAKLDEAGVDQEAALVDQEYQNQMAEKPETAEETETIRVAETESQAHDQAADIIEDAANCVMKTSAA